MQRRLLAAAPLVLGLLTACGGKEEPAPPPVVTCWNTSDVNSGTLTVGAQPTCGTASGLGINEYTFASGAAGTYSVTVTTTNGDADLHVYGPGMVLVGSSINIPPTWVDRVTFVAAAGTTYTVDVEDSNYTGPSSSYAVQVTSP